MGKKVLIVTYYWFPQSGTGIYRISKLVKYLKKAGWEPIILTASKSLSAYKEKQIDDEYKDLKVYHTKIIEPTNLFAKKEGDSQVNFNSAYVVAKNKSLKQKFIVWIRSNLFIPDAKVFWKYFAVKKGKEVIKIEKPDIILSTSPPPTTHLIARRLAKWSKIKWIADFRDPWTNIYYYENLNINPLSKKINKRLEQKVLKSADQIVTVSDNFFPGNNLTEKMIRIENGFDPDDKPLDENLSTKNSNRFIIRYIGTLKQNQFFRNFLIVVDKLSKSGLNNIELKFEFIGFVDSSIKEFIGSLQTKSIFAFYDYLPHKEAISKMSEADLLVLAIGQGTYSKNVISTKIFEYLMAGKPVIAFGNPEGSANEILKLTQGGKLFNYYDNDGIKDYLLEVIENKKKGKSNTLKKEEVEKFNFKNLTQKYIDQIMQVISN